MSAYRGALGRPVLRYLERLWADAEDDYRNRILEVDAAARPAAMVDLGCHDGAWTRRLADAAGPQLERVCGLEVVPEAADITVSDTGGVRIQARKQGETTLLVWTKDGARKVYRLVIQG